MLGHASHLHSGPCIELHKILHLDLYALLRMLAGGCRSTVMKLSKYHAQTTGADLLSFQTA